MNRFKNPIQISTNAPTLYSTNDTSKKSYINISDGLEGKTSPSYLKDYDGSKLTSSNKWNVQRKPSY